MRIAVIGAGWAGLAAAVRAVEAGHRVTVFELAAQAGGRARGVEIEGYLLDNGQHILIGACTRTLDLMRTVGADPAECLERLPLELRFPDGRGLRVPSGSPWIGFARAVLSCRGWDGRDRASLAREGLRWAAKGFRCDPASTVEQLCAGLRPAVRQLLIDPLCVAALNTPAREASAAVMLRVLRDALFSGRGASDLLLPRRSMAELLPRPAAAWLGSRGAVMHCSQRVHRIAPDGEAWRVDDESFDAAVLACSAAEAARLVGELSPEWSSVAAELRYEPIVTVYLVCPGARLPAPMTALVDDEHAPAQFAFDHGALGHRPGLFAFVTSGAGPWVERGLDAIGQAVLAQARTAFPPSTWPQAPTLLRTLAEKRATFRCTPGLRRPPAFVAPGLAAAGDYVEGPYPATLEGAVRSGERAITALSTR